VGASCAPAGCWVAVLGNDANFHFFRPVLSLFRRGTSRAYLYLSPYSYTTFSSSSSGHVDGYYASIAPPLFKPPPIDPGASRSLAAARSPACTGASTPLKSTRHGKAARRLECTGAPSSAAPERRRLAATSSTARRTFLCRSEATAFGHSAGCAGRWPAAVLPSSVPPSPTGDPAQLQRHSQSPARQPSHSAASHPAG
jgi:hypothetical protein